MVWLQWFTIEKVPLQLGIFHVQDLKVKLLHFKVSHALQVNLKIISQNNLNFFRSYMTATIKKLTSHSVEVFRRFLFVDVAELSVNFRNNICGIIEYMGDPTLLFVYVCSHMCCCLSRLVGCSETR